MSIESNRPATPAPESPAPVDLDTLDPLVFDYEKTFHHMGWDWRVKKDAAREKIIAWVRAYLAPAQGSDIGTGSAPAPAQDDSPKRIIHNRLCYLYGSATALAAQMILSDLQDAGYIHKDGGKIPEIGTGSETSPDAGASSREAVAGYLYTLTKGYAKAPWEKAHETTRELYFEEADKVLSLLAQPGEQREPEQIPTPHPVAKAEAEQSSPSLVWTKEKPTKIGWYFTKAPRLSAMICQVSRDGDGSLYVVHFGIRGTTDLAKIFPDQLWAGPIPEPEVSPNGNGGAE